jgi:hypothetical protein
MAEIAERHNLLPQKHFKDNDADYDFFGYGGLSLMRSRR